MTGLSIRTLVEPVLKIRSRLKLIQYRVLFMGIHDVHLGLLVERAPSLT